MSKTMMGHVIAACAGVTAGLATIAAHSLSWRDWWMVFAACAFSPIMAYFAGWVAGEAVRDKEDEANKTRLLEGVRSVPLRHPVDETRVF